MKNRTSKFLSVFIVLAIAILGCEQDDSVNFTQPDPTLRLDTPTANNIVLNFGLPDNPALSISWTDELTSSSSYNVEMATSETFENLVTAGSSNANSFSISTQELNSVLNSLNLASLNDASVYTRVSAGETVSNTVMFTITAYPENGAVITSPTEGESFVLSSGTVDDVVMTVTWSDVNTSETSYNIQLASQGDNFNNPVSLGTVVDNSDTLEVTHGILNAAALGFGFISDQANTAELRVIASSVNSSGAVLERVSENISISITPYNSDFPYFYLVGNAIDVNNDGITDDGDWNNNGNNPALFRSQDVPNSYSFTGYFNAGAFKFLEVLGQWQPQWGTNDGSTLAVNPGGGSDPGAFVVPADGYYTFAMGPVSEGANFTFEPYNALEAPTYTTMGLIGSATPNGWDANNDTNFIRDLINEHLWYINNVALTQGEEFLIRANDVWPSDPSAAVWRHTGSQELFGTANLNNDGGNNFPFLAPTGIYDMWFNDLDGSYVIIPNN